jgi:hypothetical protein
MLFDTLSLRKADNSAWNEGVLIMEDTSIVDVKRTLR